MSATKPEVAEGAALAAAGSSQGEGREKGVRAGKAESLQQKLAKLEREAEVIRQKLQEQKRKERDGNVRQIATLIQKEDLADFSIEAWRSALPRIREALATFSDAE